MLPRIDATAPRPWRYAKPDNYFRPPFDLPVTTLDFDVIRTPGSWPQGAVLRRRGMRWVV